MKKVINNIYKGFKLVYFMKRTMLKSTLGDPKHWIGWVLTTATIIGVFHLLGIRLYAPSWYVPVLLITIVSADVIKHYLKLQ